MNNIYLLIEHCNGDIIDEPFIIQGIEKLKDYINGEYLIYEIFLQNFKLNKIEKIKG